MLAFCCHTVKYISEIYIFLDLSCSEAVYVSSVETVDWNVP